MNKVLKNSNVLELEKEVKLLRSYVIGNAGKDPEGNYNPNFVEKVLKAAEETANYKFEDSQTFLDKLNKT